MSKSREQLREMAAVTRSLSSLEELADPIVEVFSRIEDETQGIPTEHTLAMIMGSRGTYPLFMAASHINNHGILSSPKNIRLIPHIFSIENLIEILSNGDLQYNTYAEVLDTLYQDIAERLSKKINMITSQNNHTILTDWDEVNSGNNLVERLRVYAKTQTPEQLPFFITSFVGNQGRNLKRENSLKIKQLQEKEPKNHMHITVRADESISWSDNEGFFEMTQILYPGIAAPTNPHIRNLIPRKHLGTFYQRFFREHSRLIGETIGGRTHAQYKLVPVDSERITQLNDEQAILERSLDAYLEAIEHAGEGKQDLYEHLKGPFEVDVEQGKIFRVKPNGKLQEILGRKDSTTPDHFPKYRDPFTLVYDQAAPAAGTIGRVLEAYFTDIQRYQANKAENVHVGTPSAA